MGTGEWCTGDHLFGRLSPSHDHRPHRSLRLCAKVYIFFPRPLDVTSSIVRITVVILNGRVGRRRIRAIGMLLAASKVERSKWINENRWLAMKCSAMAWWYFHGLETRWIKVSCAGGPEWVVAVAGVFDCRQTVEKRRDERIVLAFFPLCVLFRAFSNCIRKTFPAKLKLVELGWPFKGNCLIAHADGPRRFYSHHFFGLSYSRVSPLFSRLKVSTRSHLWDGRSDAGAGRSSAERR